MIAAPTARRPLRKRQEFSGSCSREMELDNNIFFFKDKKLSEIQIYALSLSAGFLI